MSISDSGRLPDTHSKESHPASGAAHMRQSYAAKSSNGRTITIDAASALVYAAKYKSTHFPKWAQFKGAVMHLFNKAIKVIGEDHKVSYVDKKHLMRLIFKDPRIQNSSHVMQAFDNIAKFSSHDNAIWRPILDSLVVGAHEFEPIALKVESYEILRHEKGARSNPEVSIAKDIEEQYDQELSQLIEKFENYDFEHFTAETNSQDVKLLLESFIHNPKAVWKLDYAKLQYALRKIVEADHYELHEDIETFCALLGKLLVEQESQNEATSTMLLGLEKGNIVDLVRQINNEQAFYVLNAVERQHNLQSDSSASNLIRGTNSIFRMIKLASMLPPEEFHQFITDIKDTREVVAGSSVNITSETFELLKQELKQDDTKKIHRVLQAILRLDGLDSVDITEFDNVMQLALQFSMIDFDIDQDLADIYNSPSMGRLILKNVDALEGSYDQITRAGPNANHQEIFDHLKIEDALMRLLTTCAMLVPERTEFCEPVSVRCVTRVRALCGMLPAIPETMHALRKEGFHAEAEGYRQVTPIINKKMYEEQDRDTLFDERDAALIVKSAEVSRGTRPFSAVLEYLEKENEFLAWLQEVKKAAKTEEGKQKCNDRILAVQARINSFYDKEPRRIQRGLAVTFKHAGIPFYDNITGNLTPMGKLLQQKLDPPRPKN